MTLKSSMEEIQHARETLDLPEQATINQIKEQYRKLCHLWHPDLQQGKMEQHELKMKEINRAYKLILEYCADYPIRFTREAFEERKDPADWWLQQFGNDPTWGPGGK